MKDIVDPVSELIRSVREKVLPHYGAVAEVQNKTGARDIVTALDFEVEKYLAERLKEIDPSAEFAGEEFGGGREAERFWLCDPIDGTQHFVRGIPYCTTMLALIEHQQVTHSFIYNFVTDELFTAERGGGAYRNGEKLQVSNRTLEAAYLGWETHLEVPKNLEAYLCLKESVMLFKTYSAGYEFTLVALGKAEGRIQFDPHGNDWDFAPGSLLVSEAGGVVANLGKRTYDYRDRNFIAANPLVYASLTEGPDAIFPIH